jgi:hypothetical protein
MVFKPKTLIEHKKRCPLISRFKQPSITTEIPNIFIGTGSATEHNILSVKKCLTPHGLPV